MLVNMVPTKKNASPTMKASVCLTYFPITPLYDNTIDFITNIYDNICVGGNNTEVDMLDLATITSMDPENPVGNETYIGKGKDVCFCFSYG